MVVIRGISSPLVLPEFKSNTDLSSGVDVLIPTWANEEIKKESIKKIESKLRIVQVCSLYGKFGLIIYLQPYDMDETIVLFVEIKR